MEKQNQPSREDILNSTCIIYRFHNANSLFTVKLIQYILTCKSHSVLRHHTGKQHKPLNQTYRKRLLFKKVPARFHRASCNQKLLARLVVVETCVIKFLADFTPAGHVYVHDGFERVIMPTGYEVGKFVEDNVVETPHRLLRELHIEP